MRERGDEARVIGDIHFVYFRPRVIRAVAIGLLLIGNLILWGTPILAGGVVKLLTFGPARRRLIVILTVLAERWVAGNNRVFDLLLTTRWDISGFDELHRDGHFLIVSNHVSWVDIFAVFRAVQGRVSFPRFFLKHALIWFPIVGQACWALEFPFMHRYSPEYLAKHPEKRGKDLETTRRACQRYRNFPVAIANFVEGTRFTRAKRDAQQSPYRHLLRPRVGGISFVFDSLGDQLDATYDVTIAYPGGEASMGEFLTGKLRRIVVRARRVEPPPPGEVKPWIESLWREKDALLDGLV